MKYDKLAAAAEAIRAVTAISGTLSAYVEPGDRELLRKAERRLWRLASDVAYKQRELYSAALWAIHSEDWQVAEVRVIKAVTCEHPHPDAAALVETLRAAMRAAKRKVNRER